MLSNEDSIHVETWWIFPCMLRYYSQLWTYYSLMGIRKCFVCLHIADSFKFWELFKKKNCCIGLSEFGCFNGIDMTLQGNVQMKTLNTGILMLVYLNLVNGSIVIIFFFLISSNATIQLIKFSQCDSLLLLFNINIYTQ